MAERTTSDKTASITITKQDLPLSCPMDGKEIWNQHPRVFLPIDREGGKAKCPYCSTEYVLKG